MHINGPKHHRVFPEGGIDQFGPSEHIATTIQTATNYRYRAAAMVNPQRYYSVHRS